MVMKYSVTSVILPDLDLVETCQLLQKLGYDGLELRVRYTRPDAVGKGYSYWGEHKTDLSPANLAERAGEVARIAADHGIEIAAIASNLRANEYEEIARLADGVARLGVIPMRLGAPRGYDRTVPYQTLYEEAVEAYGEALDVLRPYGLKTLIEIHGGTIMVSASLAYRIAAEFSPDEMGVIYDMNNMAKDGFETSRIGMELLGPYLAHCHAGGWRPVEAGRSRSGYRVTQRGLRVSQRGGREEEQRGPAASLFLSFSLCVSVASVNLCVDASVTYSLLTGGYYDERNATHPGDHRRPQVPLVRLL
jgi:sugar phosphate isomerase/epimerase